MRLRRNAEPDVVDEPTVEAVAGKGRPTPKRRDSLGPRGPVTAPKSRKEAYARQKEIAKRDKAARQTAGAAAPGARMTPAQRRAAMRSGEMLPARDQGPTKAIARDYVDTHRMFSNYLLWLFPLLVLSYAAPALGVASVGGVVQIVVIAVFIGMFVECFLVGRRIRELAVERHGSARGGAMSIGFYAVSRAYLPRRWRLPAPRLSLGEPV